MGRNVLAAGRAYMLEPLLKTQQALTIGFSRFLTAESLFRAVSGLNVAHGFGAPLLNVH